MTTAISKPNQRKLDRLSTKYEKTEESTRTFNADRVDIETLVKDGVIDHAHGLELLASAKAVKEAKDAARKTKRQEEKDKARALRGLTPIGSYRSPPAPRPSVTGAISSIQQFIGSFVSFIIFCIFIGVVFF